jgi:hypothetical protein
VHVDRAGGVVEDEDRRIDEQRARDGDALALAAREGVAALADDGVVALRAAHDELVGVGGAGRRLDLFEGGVRSAVGDVVAIEMEKRKGSSSTTPTLARSDVERHVAHVVAVDRDGAVGHVVEARQQRATVDLPEPVRPTIATVSPASMWASKSCRISAPLP